MLKTILKLQMADIAHEFNVVTINGIPADKCDLDMLDKFIKSGEVTIKAKFAQNGNINITTEDCYA